MVHHREEGEDERKDQETQRDGVDVDAAAAEIEARGQQRLSHEPLA